jgi:hypothetical protein
MDASPVADLAWALALLLLVPVMAYGRRMRRRGSYRNAAIGAMYDWQDRDKRQALEYIVEDRAEERSLEHVDGNLPELEREKGRR